MSTSHQDQLTSRSVSVEGGSTPGFISRMALNDNKAGMEGLDKEKINKIIYEASKGSKFYENERKKEKMLDKRIDEQQAVVNSIHPSKLANGLKEADKLLEQLEKSRDLSRTIVHVDMDAFYAAVEMRDNPSLKTKPMAVGGNDMLSTSNYLARKFGVRAAMPGFIGLKLCPDLVLVEANFTKYTAVSHEIREVLSKYDPNFSPMSLDEAYLDFTPHLENRKKSSPLSRMFFLRKNESPDSPVSCSCDLNSYYRSSLMKREDLKEVNTDDSQLLTCVTNMKLNSESQVCPNCGKILPAYGVKVYGQSIEEAVLEMRNRIEEKTRLTASAGIAPNMMIAKVCSDKNKPNGQYRVMPSKADVTNFISKLPIRKISGIGKVTEKLLSALHVQNCEDLFEKRALLFHLFSPTSFHHFMSITLGIGSTIIERDGDRKSMSTERTFSEINDPTLLFEKCEEMCNSLSQDLKDDMIKGKTITLKIKTVAFEVKTRSQSLPLSTNDKTTILTCAKNLLRTEIEAVSPSPLRLRLMGVRISKLENQSSSQTTLSSMFKQQSSKTEALSQPTHSKEIFTSDTSECLIVDEQNDVSIADNFDELENFAAPISSTCISNKERQRYNNSTIDTSIENFLKKNEECSKNFVSESMFNSTDKNQISHKASCREFPLILNSECERSASHVEQLRFSNTGEDNEKRQTENLASESLNPIVYICPVCHCRQNSTSLDSFNSHVDGCLNRQTIKEILHEPSSDQASFPPVHNRKRLKEASNNVKSKKVKLQQPSVLQFFKK